MKLGIGLPVSVLSDYMGPSRNGNVLNPCVRRRNMIFMLRVMNNLSWNGIGSRVEFGNMLSWMKACILTTILIIGHCLKNDQTQLAHAVGTVNAEYRLL